MINGLLMTIDERGIIFQGSTSGASGPSIDDISNDTGIKIYAKKAFINSTVSAAGNNKFTFPISFGKNICIIFVNGIQYTPGIDYTIEGNNVIWLNPSISIVDSDIVVGFGPANSYTANGFTTEIIDLTDSIRHNFNVGNQTFELNPYPTNPEADALPFNQASIYLFLNGNLYVPGIDFTFNGNNEITWLNGNALDGTETLFSWYYNDRDMEPFKLGSVLFRVFADIDSNNQESITIAAAPRSSLSESFNLFYDKIRYTRNKDYSVLFPILTTLSAGEGGSLQTELTAGSNIDISYFRDFFVSGGVNLYSEFVNAGVIADPIDNSLYDTNLSAVGDPVNPVKVMVWYGSGISGLYSFIAGYDNINNISSASVPDIYAGLGPQVIQGSSKITWDSDSRSPAIVPVAGDNFIYSAFLDDLSKSNVKIEYHQRNNASGPDTFTMDNDIKQGKVIVFYNGEALFKEFSHFSLSGTKAISGITYSRPPGSSIDEIAFMYFSDESYAGLWFFDKVEPDSAVTPGNPLNIGNPINSLNNTMLFIDGLRIAPSEYSLVPAGSGYQFTLSTITVDSSSKIMMVHT